MSDNRTVQAIRSGQDGCYYVVAFAHGLWVSPRFPVIACRSRAGAIAFAHLRARQMEPRAALLQLGENEWRVGRVLIWVVGDGR